MAKDFEVLFKDLPPLDSPACNFPGLMQGQYRYEKGFQLAEGRRALPCAMICDSDIEIRVHNEELIVYADVYRPVDQDKVPAIICWGYGGKRDTNNKIEHIGRPDENGNIISMLPKGRLSGFQGWESLDPADWVQHGYAIVNADPPGVNYSEGNLLMFGEEDSQNGYDFIEKIAAQPWCNGKVAMAGSSWYAMVQFYFAAKKPPHLVCIAPFEAEADPYRDEYVRGGVGLAGDSFSIGFRTHGRNQIEDIGSMIKKYPFDTAYWQDKEMHHEEIEIPAYVVGSYTSWYHTRGTPEGFNRLGSKEKWYRTHATAEWRDLYGEYYQEDLKKFFDHYLLGIDNGWEHTPRVRLALFNPGGETIHNRPEEQYPPARMKAMPLYLEAEGITELERSTGALHMSGEISGHKSAVLDMEHGDALHFNYTFSEYTELIGGSKLKLWLECLDSDDTAVFVRYYKIDGNGKRMTTDFGWDDYLGPEGRLRASHRELDEEHSTPLEPRQLHLRQQLLKPGEIVPLEICIWPTGLVFEAGETLQLEITGKDFVEDRPPKMIIVEDINRGRIRVHTGGEFDSHLLLPACR